MPYRENGKKLIMHDGILENLLFQDHHLIKKTKSKINSNDLHKVQIIIKYKKPTSQSYFEKVFKNSNLDWKTFYFLPRVATVDTATCFSVHVTQQCFVSK